MKNFICVVVILSNILFLNSVLAMSPIIIIHSFDGGPGDGEDSHGTLLRIGTVLYGISYSGGSAGFGTIYSMNLDGTGYTILHNFAGAPADGKNPSGGLVVAGGKLYGTTFTGGASDKGTVFVIDTDGNNFAILHSFTGGPADGLNGQGVLVVTEGKLYGTTVNGGLGGNGMAYSMDLDGNNYLVLHHFAGGFTDGRTANGALLLLDGKLYGTTMLGGSSFLGTVYVMNLDGTGYSLLHQFAGGAGDGATPNTSPVSYANGKLFGVTLGGGVANTGTLYSMNLDGSGFLVHHSFLGGATDGRTPQWELFYNLGHWYGLTTSGGVSNKGVAFTINEDGSGFEIFHSFDGSAAGGSGPIGGFFKVDNYLYGGTSQGGANNKGVVYKLEDPIGIRRIDGINVSATIPSSLTFTVSGASSGGTCANSGGNANVTSTATTISFGLYPGAQTKIACQTLTLSTNATDGYVVAVEQNQDLTSAAADTISKFTGTCGTPIVWSSPSGGAHSYFGFTTDDTDYPGFQTAKYAGFAANNTPYAIAAVSGPVENQSHVISYQLEVNNLQEVGVYTNNIMYIATAKY